MATDLNPAKVDRIFIIIPSVVRSYVANSNQMQSVSLTTDARIRAPILARRARR